MKVKVNHFAKLKRGSDRDHAEVELEPGATVADLLSGLGIEQDDVGILIVNGKPATFHQKLEHGGHVTLIPHIGGG